MNQRLFCVLLTCQLLAGCATVTGRFTDERVGPSRIVDVTPARYSVARHALVDDSLVLQLDRTCPGTIEYERTIYQVDTQVYETTGWWAATGVAGTVGTIGLIVNEGEEALVATSGTLLGTSLLGASLLTWLELNDPFTSETVEGRSTHRESADELSCRDGWPHGEGRLYAPVSGLALPAHFDGDGRAEVDLSHASDAFWQLDDRVFLEQPEHAEWIDVVIDPRMRENVLAHSIGEHQSGVPERASEMRAFAWVDRSDAHHELLAPAAARLEATLTQSGRYRFASDGTTRERIDDLTESGGGSAEAHFAQALQAANQHNISRVFGLALQTVDGDSAQLVLSVFDAASSDRLLQLTTRVDSSRPWEVVLAAEQLAEAYLAFDEGDTQSSHPVVMRDRTHPKR